MTTPLASLLKISPSKLWPLLTWALTWALLLTSMLLRPRPLLKRLRTPQLNLT